MSACIFCDILSGSTPASFILRDAWCAAFMDNHPVNRGHMLVVPVRHVELLAELDGESLAHMLQMAQRVEIALRTSGIRCEGVNLYLADGRPAGQEVMHVHLHVIPRFPGDGHHLRFSPTYFAQPASQDLEADAALIRKQLESEQ